MAVAFFRGNGTSPLHANTLSLLVHMATEKNDSDLHSLVSKNAWIVDELEATKRLMRKVWFSHCTVLVAFSEIQIPLLYEF